MISLVLIFGIFFAASCATLFQDEITPDELYQQGNYEKALTAAEKAAADNPDDYRVRLLKAEILNKLAHQKEHPADRTPYYKDLKNSVDQVSFETNRHTFFIDSLLSHSWNLEQQEGVKLLQQDDTENLQNHSARIIAHFENAIVLIPDSTVTHSLKATTHYKIGDNRAAISTLEHVKENGGKITPKMLEKLAYLYKESGMLDESITIYRELTESSPDNERFNHGLVNAYILKEDHTNAISVLHNLLELNPDNREYREALATETFLSVSKDITTLLQQSDLSSDEKSEKIRAVVNKLDEVSEIYDELEIRSTRNEESLLRAASFHNNSAIFARLLAEHSDSDDLIRDLHAHSTTMLQSSLPYWQALSQYFPDSVSYAENLYNVYRDLEMDDEADFLHQQINF